MVFDKVEDRVLRLLEVFIKTDGGRLLGKLQLCEPSTSFCSGQGTACPREFWGGASCT